MTLSQSTRLNLRQHPEPIPILYVEDEPEDAQALQDQLGSSIDNPVICFTSGSELYAYLDEHEGDTVIILVDLVLLNELSGSGGGYDVITQLRRRPGITETQSPIIAVTGTSLTTPIIQHVRRIGANGVLPKPVHVSSLADVIGRPGWFRLLFRKDPPHEAGR